MKAHTQTLVILLLAVCCANGSTLPEAREFEWGPSHYPLEDVEISARWSMFCSSDMFSLNEVIVRGDGTVEVTHMRAAGDSIELRRIHRSSVVRLISEFYRLGFFSMNEQYPLRMWVPLPKKGIVIPESSGVDYMECLTTVTFKAGEYSKSVESNGAAPPDFETLAKAVAEAAMFGKPVCKRRE